MPTTEWQVSDGVTASAACAADDPRLAHAQVVVAEAHALVPFVGIVTLGEGIAGIEVTVTAPELEAE